MNETDDVKGLGGWLVLVGFGLVVTSIQISVSMFTVYKPIFEDGTWEALTTVGTDAYHPLWAQVLIGEITFNVLILAASIYLIYLFFSKHYLFPRGYIALVAVLLAFIPVDAWMVAKIFPDEPMFDPDTTKEFLRSLVMAAVWIPYMLFSKRVEATFVENKPHKNLPPTIGRANAG